MLKIKLMPGLLFLNSAFASGLELEIEPASENHYCQQGFAEANSSFFNCYQGSYFTKDGSQKSLDSSLNVFIESSLKKLDQGDFSELEGPNCFNIAIGATLDSGESHRADFMGPTEFMYNLDMFYHEVTVSNLKDLKIGDILALPLFKHMEGYEYLHAMVYVGFDSGLKKHLILHKNGAEKTQPIYFSTLADALAMYNDGNPVDLESSHSTERAIAEAFEIHRLNPEQ